MKLIFLLLLLLLRHHAVEGVAATPTHRPVEYEYESPSPTSKTQSCPLTGLTSACSSPCLDGRLVLDGNFSANLSGVYLASRDSRMAAAWTVDSFVHYARLEDVASDRVVELDLPFNGLVLDALALGPNVTLVFYSNISFAHVAQIDFYNASNAVRPDLTFSLNAPSAPILMAVYAGRFVMVRNDFVWLAADDASSAVVVKAPVSATSFLCGAADSDGFLILVYSNGQSAMVYGLGSSDALLSLTPNLVSVSPSTTCYMASDGPGSFTVVFNSATNVGFWTANGGMSWSTAAPLGDVYTPGGLYYNSIQGYFVMVNINKDLLLPTEEGGQLSACRVNYLTFYNVSSDFVPRYSNIDYAYITFTPSEPFWLFLPSNVTDPILLSGTDCRSSLAMTMTKEDGLIVAAAVNYHESSLIRSACTDTYNGAMAPPSMSTLSPSVVPSQGPSPSIVGPVVGGVLGGIVVVAGALFVLLRRRGLQSAKIANLADVD